VVSRRGGKGKGGRGGLSPFPTPDRRKRKRKKKRYGADSLSEGSVGRVPDKEEAQKALFPVIGRSTFESLLLPPGVPARKTGEKEGRKEKSLSPFASYRIRGRGVKKRKKKKRSTTFDVTVDDNEGKKEGKLLPSEQKKVFARGNAKKREKEKKKRKERLQFSSCIGDTEGEMGGKRGGGGRGKEGERGGDHRKKTASSSDLPGKKKKLPIPISSRCTPEKEESFKFLYTSSFSDRSNGCERGKRGKKASPPCFPPSSRTSRLLARRDGGKKGKKEKEGARFLDQLTYKGRGGEEKGGKKEKKDLKNRFLADSGWGKEKKKIRLDTYFFFIP